MSSWNETCSQSPANKEFDAPITGSIPPPEVVPLACYQAEKARADAAEAKLREVRAILYAYDGTKAGNCITSDPYWLILRNGCLRGDDSVLAGPFFSKDEAEAHRMARIYDYKEKSYTYAMSAYHSRPLRRLREIVKEVSSE